MISVEEWLIIRNLKRNHPDMGVRRIAEFLGRSRRAVKKALSSEGCIGHSEDGRILLFSEPSAGLSDKETVGVMARGNILMNKIIEGIYEWHKGSSLRRSGRSSGMDRKMLRKYLTVARRCGVVREHPFEGAGGGEQAEHSSAGEAQGSCYTRGPHAFLQGPDQP